MAIRVIATGGTIASLPDPASGAVRPAVAAADLVAGVPGLDRLGPVSVEEVARVNGWNLTPSTMLEVAARAAAAAADPAVDGVVVTHGTDTLEETAFLCDLMVDGEAPVAFAAALRSAAEVSADGPRNLLNAALVARDPAAAGAGAVVVMNDEVHAARWARKVDSHRVGAFASPGHGPIGLVSPAGAELRWPPPGRVTLPRPAALDRPVAIVQAYTGMEEGLIAAVLEATGAAGLVLEGTGLGNVPGSAQAGIARAREAGLPVVVATRTLTGGTRAVYGGPGGGVTLRELGVVPAAGLSAAKARLLLMLLLAGDRSGEEAALAFADAAERLR
jgi:L-asparaginase